MTAAFQKSGISIAAERGWVIKNLPKGPRPESAALGLRGGGSYCTLFLEEPSADYHLCDIRCQAIHSLGPLSAKTS